MYREKGVGSTTDLGPGQGLESNKTEVLRLLLVLLSRQIYTSPSQLLTKPSIYTLQLVQKTQRRDVLTLLCSLLNSALNPPSASLTTVGGVTGRLPYNHLVFKGEEPREGLVIMCLQVLCVLLDCQSGSARDATLANGESIPTIKTNMFRYYLAKLVRKTRILLSNSSQKFSTAQATGFHVHTGWHCQYPGTTDGLAK